MRKASFFLFFLTVFISTSSCSYTAESHKKKIGIMVWSEEGRYQTCLEGFLDGLAKEGFPPSGLDITIKRPDGNKVLGMRMAEELANNGDDLYFSIGTGALSALSKEVGQAPLVFGMSYDPVGAGFVKSLERSGNNLTGVTAYVSMKDLLSVLVSIRALRRLAIFYTPGEANSESQVKDLQAVSLQSNVEIVPVPLAAEDDAASLVHLLKGKAEAVFLSGSSVVGKKVEDIVKAAVPASIVTVTHLLDFCDRGVAVGVGIDLTRNGRRAAAMAARIFRGTAPTDIPIERVEPPSIVVNTGTLKAMGLVVPEGLKPFLTRTIE